MAEESPITPRNDGSADERPRLEQVIAAYLRAGELGMPVDREELIARHPDLADHLRSFFAAQDVGSAPRTDDVRTADPTEAPTLPPSSAGDVAHEAETLPPRDYPTPDTTGAVHSALRTPNSALGTVRYFGDYELLEEIARGGMGVVYKARQVSLNRIVALKMILAGQLASEDDVRRFYTEAEAAANLDHPGIVPIYEVGQHEGQHYFSMGFVEGQSLAAKVAAGPLPPREAAELVLKVAEAIAYAHERGVIHRDLKPGNILLDKTGQPRVTDFGLAKRVSASGGRQPPDNAADTADTDPNQPANAGRSPDRSGLTLTGQVLGTPSYMPPEQAAGKVDEVGPLADVYSLGAILYTLLTGRPPFHSANVMDTLLAVLEQEPVPPRALNAQINRDLDTICLKCLEKESRRRYTSARQLAEELERYLRGEPIHARPIGRLSRVWRWCRRNPWLALAIAAVALVLTVATLVSGLFGIEARQQAGLARERAKQLEQQLYVQRVNRAYREWERADVGLARQLLELCPPEYRNWEWFYCWQLCHQEKLIFAQHDSLAQSGHTYTTGVLDVAFRPGGGEVASAGADGVVHLWDPSSGRIIRSLRGHTGKVYAVDYSADGRLIASGGQDGKIQLWDASTGKLERTLADHEEFVLDLAFSPDGNRLVSGGGSWGLPSPRPNDFAVRIWDVTSGKLMHKLRGHAKSVWAVAFSPNGRRVASGAHDDSVRVWDSASGELQAVLTPCGQVVHAVAFDPTSKSLAVGGEFSGDITLWDVASRRVLRTFQGHGSIVRCLVFTSDGQHLFSCSEDNTIRVWDTAAARVLRTLRGHTGFVNSVALDAAAGLVASASDDASVRLWDTSAGTDSCVLRGHSSFVDDVAVSPDGRHIASGSHLGLDQGNALFIWDEAAGRIIAQCDGDGAAFCIAYRPDGEEIATTSWDSTVRFWDEGSLNLHRRIRAHEEQIHAIAYHPGGKVIASASQDKTAKIWDPNTGDVYHTLRGHSQPVRGVAFHPTDDLLASIGQDDRVRVWDTSTGGQVACLEAPCPVFGHSPLAFSSDGGHLAAACGDGTARVWRKEGDTWELRWTLRGHTAAVYQVAFTPDSTRLASASNDKTIRLWDIATGQEVFTLRGHNAAVLCVAFTPDGRKLVSGSVDHTVRAWDATGIGRRK